MIKLTRQPGRNKSVLGLLFITEMEAIHSSETSVNLYFNTRYQIPEDDYRFCETLKDVLTFASGRSAGPGTVLSTGAVLLSDEHVPLGAVVANCGPHAEVGTGDGGVD